MHDAWRRGTIEGESEMAVIHHFDHGWITPTASYVLSVLGSLLGLTCAIRLRTAPSAGARYWWLSLAAVALGGTAIWSMHFVAMLGFSVVGTQIRYDVGLTAASALIAMVSVGLGLVIAFFGSSARLARIILGGVVAGLGVAAMHYTGMAAMRLDGQIDYSTSRVILSIVIAVVAATAALWLAINVHKPFAIVGAAFIMGIAVNGMHFTGMSAMSVIEHPEIGPLAGATASTLLVPIGLAVVFGVLGLLYALLAAPTEADRAGAAYMQARMTAADRPATPVEPLRPFGSVGPAAPAQPTPPAQPPAAPPSGRPGSALGGSSWTFRDRSNH
jgi:NO-binding membrane sensor protein with MHYT domain